MKDLEFNPQTPSKGANGMQVMTNRPATALQKVGWGAEFVLGLMVPTVFVAPPMALGLLFGFWGVVIAVMHLSWNGIVAGCSFLLPALGGLLGLSSIAVLLFRRNPNRRVLSCCAFGLLTGVLTSLYLFLPPPHATDRFYIGNNRAYWAAVFGGPAVVGLHRLLLWMRVARTGPGTSQTL